MAISLLQGLPLFYGLFFRRPSFRCLLFEKQLLLLSTLFRSGSQSFQHTFRFELSVSARQARTRPRSGQNRRPGRLRKAQVPTKSSTCMNSLCRGSASGVDTSAVSERLALQPSALSECRKISSRWGIPATRAIAGAELQSDLLVAIRNP
jgi:hypothetical protein